MSHVTHINNYKKSLLALGIASPETQIALTRSAYVVGIVRAFQFLELSKEERSQFLPQMLSYWNEIFPVDVYQVTIDVNKFYNQLTSELKNIKTKLFINIGENESTSANPNYDDPETYEVLVKTITNEVLSKYEKMVKAK